MSIGWFMNGNENGWCLTIYDNGDVYEGEIKEGLLHGKGRYTWSDDISMYQGYWLNNDMDGYGVFIDADGDKYEGQFLKIEYHGKGKFTEANGKTTEGTWTNNKMHGSFIRSTDSVKYLESWEDDELESSKRLKLT